MRAHVAEKESWLAAVSAAPRTAVGASRTVRQTHCRKASSMLRLSASGESASPTPSASARSALGWKRTAMESPFWRHSTAPATAQIALLQRESTGAFGCEVEQPAIVAPKWKSEERSTLRPLLQSVQMDGQGAAFIAGWSMEAGRLTRTGADGHLSVVARAGELAGSPISRPLTGLRASSAARPPRPPPSSAEVRRACGCPAARPAASAAWPARCTRAPGRAG